MIDNSSCKSAIQDLKSNVNKCFEVCELKGSTYIPQNKTLANNELFNAIGGIPSSSSGVTSYAQNFSGFNTSSSGSTITLNCGGIGANWKCICIYSLSKKGWFSIYKITSSICILSANPWYAITGDPVLDDGEFPYSLESSSFRCAYSVSGNNISLTVDTYVGQDSSVDLSICCNQINTNSTYMLDIIDIIY